MLIKYLEMILHVELFGIQYFQCYSKCYKFNFRVIMCHALCCHGIQNALIVIATCCPAIYYLHGCTPYTHQYGIYILQCYIHKW